MFILRIYSISRLNYLLSLILLLSLVSCSGGDGDSTSASTSSLSRSVELNWIAPSGREDGSGLSLSEIGGYRLYYGVESGNYQSQIEINDSSADKVELIGIGIPRGTYYVVMTTVDMDGRESLYSSEVVVNL